MKTLKFVNQILLAGLVTACGHANASSYQGRISSILLYERGDLVYIYFEGGTQNKPACAGSNGDYISFSMKRPRAKEYLAGLMMAYSMGKVVSVYTSSACVDQDISDTLEYFTF